jgi:hypothetical protein
MELLVILLIAWLTLPLVVGWAAGQKGRSRFGFFILSVFLTPLIGILVLIAVPTRTRAAPGTRTCRTCGQNFDGTKFWRCPHCKAAAALQMKNCPMCAEPVLVEARKCKHCGSDLDAPRDLPVNGTRLAQSNGPVVPSSKPPPAGLGYCPQCKKLRGLTVNRCLNCGNTDLVPVS